MAQFEKPENVALMPDKSLTTRKHKPGQQDGRSNDPKQISSNQNDNTLEEERTSGTSALPDDDGSTTLLSPPPTLVGKSENTKDMQVCIHLMDSVVPSLPFAKEKATKPLRVCCYGSSSSKTPDCYLQPAAEVGYLLGVRGHTCVNGAGSFGCMAAINDGAAAGNGHIVGVIHKMWLVDGEDSLKDWGIRKLRDGGSHSVFSRSSCDAVPEMPQSHGGPHSALSLSTEGGPKREMLVAGGKDLQQRKRLLVEGANALIVLPGGPGTWDELWEMACARNIGLSKLPIVCVNIDGYYDPFRQILQRAWKDQLAKLEPSEIIHFVDSAEAAVKWIEEVQDCDPPAVLLKKTHQAGTRRSQSVLGSPVTEGRNQRTSWQSSSALNNLNDGEKEGISMQWASLSLALGTGLVMGFILSQRLKSYQ